MLNLRNATSVKKMMGEIRQEESTTLLKNTSLIALPHNKGHKISTKNEFNDSDNK